MGYDCTTDACCGPSYARSYAPTYGAVYAVTHGVPRRYITKEEKIARLQGYREALERELTGVKERIDDLGGTSE